MARSSFHQIFFVRPPVPGRVKTRLARFLGDEKACELYTQVLAGVTEGFDRAHTTFFSSEDDKMERLLPIARQRLDELRVQTGNDLGERMANALHQTAREMEGEDTPILLAGGDIPDYSPRIAKKAVQSLGQADVVLGPACDGGYYLVGVRAALAREFRTVHQMFQGVPWSTSDTLSRQVARLEDLGLTCSTSPELFDIDEIGDLLLWLKHGAPDDVHDLIPDIRVVMPVYNEIENLRFVIEPLRSLDLFREIICADNGSTDGSRELALELGARSTLCEERGYGATCLTALEDIRSRGGCDVVLFVDGDGADEPDALVDILAPVTSGRADLSLGERRADLAERGALLPHQRFGNWLSTTLVKTFFGFRYRDLGPCRAIGWEALEKLHMQDRNFGWTIEMQIRAIKQGLRIVETPVPYRTRHAGKSKVTATIMGSIRAGFIIISTVFRELLSGRAFRRE